MNNSTFLQNKGGYRKLVVFQITEIIYDITYYFTGIYLDRKDRTVDQMIQAARSGNGIAVTPGIINSKPFARVNG